jgi:hypothetical protein
MPTPCASPGDIVIGWSFSWPIVFVYQWLWDGAEPYQLFKVVGMAACAWSNGNTTVTAPVYRKQIRSMSSEWTVCFAERPKQFTSSPRV